MEIKGDLKMEKFLVDRDEVIMAINQTYASLYHDEKLTLERLAVANFSQGVIDRINSLDVQKIEGIDLGKGDGKVFPNN